ncbi:MAG: hypothetical protein PHE53_00125 [Thermoguttaceae bacterium]|nr:hypothetical protein [Thermoguttaceae bacterium]
MYSIKYQLAITTLWLAAFGWFVYTWVFPWMLIGEPPQETDRLQARQEEPLVWWEIRLLRREPTTSRENAAGEPANTNRVSQFFHSLNPFRTSKKTSDTSSQSAQSAPSPTQNTQSPQNTDFPTDGTGTPNATDIADTPQSLNNTDTTDTTPQPAAQTTRVLGQAYCLCRIGGAGVSQIDSLVEFERLPIRELMPPMLRMFLGHTIPEELSMTCRNTMYFDALGKLMNFHSTVDLPKWNPVDPLVIMTGSLRAEGLSDMLQLSVQVMASQIHHVEIPLSEETPWAEMLTPETQLPGLRLGQVWTIQTYNPLETAASTINPLGGGLRGEKNAEGLGGISQLNDLSSIQSLTKIRAEVTSREPYIWNGKTLQCFVVQYTTADDDLGGKGQPVGRLHVDPEGNVLQEEFFWNPYVVQFVRQPLPPRGSEEANQLQQKILLKMQPPHRTETIEK